MGIHAVGKAADGIGVMVEVHAGDAKEVSLVDAQDKLAGGQKDDPARIAAEMTKQLQEQVDVRYPRTDLWPGDSKLEPDDPNFGPDPVFESDPATERVFWDGSDVVERVAVVTVVYDGTEYVPYTRAL